MAWFLGTQNDTNPRDISGVGVLIAFLLIFLLFWYFLLLLWD
jgi:hypothetical protein